jgi:pimeloyl-ACP methyl ester carboxylesterase
MRAWASPEWAASADFAAAAAHYRSAVQVPGTVHSAMEYYRWAARSQLRAEGPRFAAAVARTPMVPVLQVHGALDPCVLARTVGAAGRWAGPEHRLQVLPAVGHFPHEERPAETTTLLLKALAR